MLDLNDVFFSRNRAVILSRRHVQPPGAVRGLHGASHLQEGSEGGERQAGQLGRSDAAVRLPSPPLS